MIPKIIFKKMSLEDNIEIIKWAYYEEDKTLDVHNYVIEYFEELKNISNESKEETDKLISNIIEKEYYKYEDDINKEIIKYQNIWDEYNDLYISELSKYLNISWDKDIICNIGMIPIFPRDIDNNTFSISINLDKDKLIEVCAHEVCHFLWFKKFREIYPNIQNKEYNSPYLPWKYSEIVVDPIINSKNIKNIIHIDEKAYLSFYKINNGKLMHDIINIYNENISIEERIKKGYEYLKKES